MSNIMESGLDMRETIKWYEKSGIMLPPLFAGSNLPYSVDGRELIELSKRELGALFNLFPENARKRSSLRKVVGKPTTWFDKQSAEGKLTPTTDESEALSPTAIIPSYIDYMPWKESRIPTADIWLYKLPDSIPKGVRRIIQGQGFVHEIGHSVVPPAIYLENHNLRLPDGKLISGLEAITEFSRLSEQHHPISHYASSYRLPDNKFKGENPNTAISEEFCETIAAHFLGFAFCKDDSRGKNPFADRPEVKDFIFNFLNAELVN